MIKSSEYKFISDRLGEVHSEAVDGANSLGGMLEHLRENPLPLSDTDKLVLAKSISDTYLVILKNNVAVSDDLSKLVKALQRHIEKYFVDVNDFLSINDLRVSPDFASLSGFCGYEIFAENIE